MQTNELQLWNCFSYYPSVHCFDWLDGINGKFLGKNKKFYKGNYLFTIDSCHSDPNELNVSLSETPNEHKSFNIIKMENGQFAAQPNNRVLYYDQSLTPKGIKVPDFKVSTKEFFCEDGTKWSVGDQDVFFYDDKSED